MIKDFRNNLPNVSLTSAQMLTLLLSVSLLTFVFLTDFILKPQSPAYPFLAKNSSKPEVEKAVQWHLKYNLKAFLDEDFDCAISTVKDQKAFSIICPFLNNKLNISTNDANPLSALLGENFSLHGLIWSANKDSQNFINRVKFLPSSYQLLEIKKIEEGHGLFGKELKVALTLKRDSESKVLNAIKALASKQDKNLKELLFEEDKETIETTIYFYSNQYGFYTQIFSL